MKVTRILTPEGNSPVTDAVREFLAHSEVEVADSVAGRFWLVRLSEALAIEWSTRLKGWTLESEKHYPVPGTSAPGDPGSDEDDAQ